MRRVLAGVLVVLALAIAGCGGSESTHNRKAAAENTICMEQADHLAETAGAAAGERHLEECVSMYAHDTEVEE